jgi:hypothetical protein
LRGQRSRNLKQQNIPGEIAKCDGFKISVTLDVSQAELKQLLDSDVEIECFTKCLNKKYRLFPIWCNGEYMFYRHFYWVSGNYVLQVHLSAGNRFKDQQRVVVRISQSQCAALRDEVVAILNSIESDTSGREISERTSGSTRESFLKLNKTYGEGILHFLHHLMDTKEDFRIRCKILSILALFRNRLSIEPVLDVYRKEENQAINSTIVRFFADLGMTKVEDLFIKAVRSQTDPSFRIKALQVLSSLGTDQSRQVIEQAAEFESATEVKKEATKILKVMEKGGS